MYLDVNAFVYFRRMLSRSRFDSKTEQSTLEWSSVFTALRVFRPQQKEDEGQEDRASAREAFFVKPL